MECFLYWKIKCFFSTRLCDDVAAVSYTHLFSLEKALWLHSLSLTIPFNMTMSFPYGTNTKNIKEADICPIILRSHYSEGIIEIERLPGRFIKVYEVERVLVECLCPAI